MVNISIVSLHCVKNDAISNVMKMYSDWLRSESGYTVKCFGYRTEYTQDELPFKTVATATDMLLDSHFQHSQIIIFQFGIYYPLMDLISLTPLHAKVLAIFHNVTPKEFIAPQQHALIDKSFAQMHNLQFADYVICDSPTNLKVLRAHNIQTPATILPLCFKKMYGTPSYKPSFYDGITRLAFIGRFVRSKGPLDLLSAMGVYLSEASSINKQAGLELTIVCNKDHSELALLEEAQNRALALENAFKEKLKIKFLFNIPDAEKFQVLQDADIFVLPTYHEGFCVPIVEALSNGCRIVAYNNSNVPFVAGQDAHLAHTGSISALTEQLGAAIAVVNSEKWWTDAEVGYAAFTNRSSEHLAQFSPALSKQRLFYLFAEVQKMGQITRSANNLGKSEREALTMQEKFQKKRPIGVNALGFFSGMLGLGEAARAMAHGLSRLAPESHPLQLTDFRVSHQPPAVDKTFQDFDSDFKYAFNLTMLNPSEHKQGIEQYGLDKFQGRYNIGLWYWELVDIIHEWQPGFELIDELWVTTSYIRDNLLQSSSVPVHKVTIPIVIDSSKVSNARVPFGLPEDTFLFVFAFDHNSIMSRKNPKAVIDAFRLAFGGRTDVGLVVKTLNGDKYPDRQQALREASRDLNVFLIDGELERYQSFSLYAACDSYVSLHRAEGLGLAMAEAMYLGKPVIATGYSGNMEFMNHQNSMPVRYKMVEIQEDQSLYRKGQWWAEPDVAHAAQCMQALVADIDLCQALGARAKLHIQTHFSIEEARQSMHDRLNEIAETRGKIWGFCS